jgi:hypothetical protein
MPPPPPLPRRAGIAAQKAGNLPQAFVMFLKYMNLGQVTKGHNAFSQKVYERDRRKLERQMQAVVGQMERLKPQLLEQQRQRLSRCLRPLLRRSLHRRRSPSRRCHVRDRAVVGEPRLLLALLWAQG